LTTTQQMEIQASHLLKCERVSTLIHRFENNYTKSLACFPDCTSQKASA
jgi:hypothetical protein